MAASPPTGGGGCRQWRQNSLRRYRAMSTFLTCPGIDLIYERATVFERGLSLDCIRHQTPPSVFFLDATEQSETTIIFWTRALHDSAAYLDSRPSCLTCSASNAPNAPAKAATESAGSRETRPQANMTKWKEQLNGDCRSGRSRHWVKSKNPKHPAVEREAEEDWGKEKWRRRMAARTGS
jgi:hypothetical protein